MVKKNKEIILSLKKSASNSRGLIRSILIIGSGAIKDLTCSDSDLDVLVILRRQMSIEDAKELNKLIRGSEEFNRDGFFVFYKAVCERCKLLTHNYRKIHFIIHNCQDIKKWLKKHEWIVCMWSQNYEVIYGDDPFKRAVKPMINSSLLDRWDGIPGMIKEIKSIISCKDPIRDSCEYVRYIKFAERRIDEFKKYLPVFRPFLADVSDYKSTNLLKKLCFLGTKMEGLAKLVKDYLRKK